MPHPLRALAPLAVVAAVLGGCDGTGPAATGPDAPAAAATTPPGPVPTRDPSQVVLPAGDDPAWCGPVVTATILQPDGAAVVAGDEEALGQAGEVAQIAAGAALEPEVPEVVASYMRDTASLMTRLVETRGQLAPEDDPLGARLTTGTAPFYEAVEPACDDTIADLAGPAG